MKNTVLILILIVISSYSFTQQINSFIPKDHEILDSLSYDYNKDLIPDIFIVCRHINEENMMDSINEFTTRPFIILEGNHQNKYNQILRNDNLVLCYDCGGVFGDPFDGISFSGDTLVIGHYGGSTWKWTKTGKYNYISELKDWVITEYSESNFNSFDYENTNEEQGIKYYPKQIIKMKDFDIYNQN